ncbi:lysophospholipid acyltransferase family protein [uncultured Dialister sp.]|jgi:1-acyl-sn-glycerol-3-phosphate acyltransferase|uniref:lysophospholipid acyltransferase family protein n=1 Tax=uncultured Dialister sp. TaxID=278064 RepID=UPI0025CE0534|nr:lysophospholipid acyltransferase family protein [uncultured Dialister sp.]
MGYTIVRAVLDFLFFGIFRLYVEGRENVPQTGAIIVAPNHKSDWDPPLIGVAFNTRIIHYMAKEELFKNPFLGWLIRQFGTFPVKRGTVDRAAIRRAIRELKAGNPLGIFPEGTRIRRDGLGRFHSGMASLALMTGTPVVPVAVIGSRWLPHRKGPLAVLIGKPVPVKKQRPTDEKVAELNEVIKGKIQGLMDDYMKRVKG